MRGWCCCLYNDRRGSLMCLYNIIGFTHPSARNGFVQDGSFSFSLCTGRKLRKRAHFYLLPWKKSRRGSRQVINLWWWWIDTNFHVACWCVPGSTVCYKYTNILGARAFYDGADGRILHLPRRGPKVWLICIFTWWCIKQRNPPHGDNRVCQGPANLPAAPAI